MTPYLQTFDQHRPHLFGIAYRMLGSVMDAEDMVQDAFLRWRSTDLAAVKSPKAFLTTLITRLSIDQLRSAKQQRETYIGPWLPEPLLATPETAHAERMVILSESLSQAFLLLLEQLSPTERAVFLLRHVFDYSYADIAAIVNKSEANCRQIFRRAQTHVAAARPRFEPSSEAHRQLFDAFAAACFAGDLDQLVQLLTEDVVATSDGGGKAFAARKPIVGAANVARFVANIARSAPDGFAMHYQTVNGVLGMVGYVHGQPMMVMVPEIVTTGDGQNGRICALRSILNPDKLRHIPPLTNKG